MNEKYFSKEGFTYMTNGQSDIPKKPSERPAVSTTAENLKDDPIATGLARKLLSLPAFQVIQHLHIGKTDNPARRIMHLATNFVNRQFLEDGLDLDNLNKTVILERLLNVFKVVLDAVVKCALIRPESINEMNEIAEIMWGSLTKYAQSYGVSAEFDKAINAEVKIFDKFLTNIPDEKKRLISATPQKNIDIRLGMDSYTTAIPNELLAGHFSVLFELQEKLTAMCEDMRRKDESVNYISGIFDKKITTVLEADNKNTPAQGKASFGTQTLAPKKSAVKEPAQPQEGGLATPPEQLHRTTPSPVAKNTAARIRPLWLAGAIIVIGSGAAFGKSAYNYLFGTGQSNAVATTASASLLPANAPKENSNPAPGSVSDSDQGSVSASPSSIDPAKVPPKGSASKKAEETVTPSISNKMIAEFASGKYIVEGGEIGKHGIGGELAHPFLKVADLEHKKAIFDLMHKINIGSYAAYVDRYGSMDARTINEIRHDPTNPDHDLFVSLEKGFMGRWENWDRKIENRKTDYEWTVLEAKKFFIERYENGFIDFEWVEKNKGINIHRGIKAGQTLTTIKDGKYHPFIEDLAKAANYKLPEISVTLEKTDGDFGTEDKSGGKEGKLITPNQQLPEYDVDLSGLEDDNAVPIFVVGGSAGDAAGGNNTESPVKLKSNINFKERWSGISQRAQAAKLQNEKNKNFQNAVLNMERSYKNPTEARKYFNEALNEIENWG